MEASVIIALCGVLISALVAMRSGKRDTRADAAKEAAASARVETKLDSINTGVTDIRAEIRSMRMTEIEHGERLSRLEGRADEAERQIGLLDKRFHQAHPPA